MKNIKILLLLLLGLSLITSCVDDDNDELTGSAITGGLVKPTSNSIGYVVGNGDTYTAGGTVFQGNVQTETVEVYNSFTSSQTGETSNEVLLATLDITGMEVGTDGEFATSFDYNDLIDGLTLSGNPLPADDGNLSIGDFWTLRFVSKLSNGNTVSNAATTKVSVGTRFAGTYAVVESVYYRIGVNRDDVAWPEEMLIESVDATTYRVVEYFGAFSGNEYYFQIDANDKITYPEETPDGEGQTGNGQPLTTCDRNPGDLTNVPCGDDTNLVIRDDVTGKDRLVMTFGYFTAGSGPREFYQVLEKIVE